MPVVTIAQAAFALFLLCCTPGFGVCGGLFCEHTKRRWCGGLAIGAFGGFFGLCVSGAIAGMRHPRYPIEGPPEHTALLYLIPAFVIGIVVVLLLEQYGGNPYPFQLHGKDSMRLYLDYLRRSPSLVDRARRELVGKTLACFCAPGICHGDVLARLADGQDLEVIAEDVLAQVEAL